MSILDALRTQTSALKKAQKLDFTAAQNIAKNIQAAKETSQSIQENAQKSKTV